MGAGGVWPFSMAAKSSLVATAMGWPTQARANPSATAQIGALGRSGSGAGDGGVYSIRYSTQGDAQADFQAVGKCV
jgi:hypothetical protein